MDEPARGAISPVRKKSAGWNQAPRTFDHLVTIVEAMHLPAQRLAATFGNFQGTDAFASTGPELDSGFILDEVRHDWTALMVVRAYALLAVPKIDTDATLPGAADLLDEPTVAAELFARAEAWEFPNASVARLRAGRIPDKLREFRQVLDELETGKMRDHRNWVVAHTTINKPPPMKNGEVWTNVAATLRAFDALGYAVLEQGTDVVGLSENRVEQSGWFWRDIAQSEGD